MFKKLSFIFMLAIAAMVACTEDAPTPKFTLDSNMVTLNDGASGATDILLSSNVDLTATVEEGASAWLSAEVSRYSLKLTYSQNDS